MPTPKTRPRSWTRALAVFATPDWRCSVASSHMPIVKRIPGRKVTSAASVTTSGEADTPSSTSAAAQKLAATAATGATMGSARAVWRAGSAIAPTTRPTIAPATASRQPPPRTGVSAAPAIAYAPRSSGQGRSVGVAPLVEPGERLLAVDLFLEDVLDELVQTGDRVEVDAARLHAQREALLPRDCAERDVDPRRRRRDLRLVEPERLRERDDALLEIGGRIARLVTVAREPKHELDGSIARARHARRTAKPGSLPGLRARRGRASTRDRGRRRGRRWRRSR